MTSQVAACVGSVVVTGRVSPIQPRQSELAAQARIDRRRNLNDDRLRFVIEPR